MRLIGVGMGPGDPELVTVKAVRLLAAADRVFVPVLPEPGGAADATQPGRAEATVRAHAGHGRIERLPFALNERVDGPADAVAAGRRRRERHWDAAGARVADWLRDTGGTAVFATIGDPHVYSTFGYLAATVRTLLPAVRVETVPGITAMQALAAAAGLSLVEGAEPLTLLPLARGLDARLPAALSGDGTVVLYKGGRHLPQIAAALRAAGRPAVYGAHLGLPEQQVGAVSDLDGPAPYLATVIVPARRTAQRGGKL